MAQQIKITHTSNGDMNIGIKKQITMAQYRKKPVVIEAVQWDGNLDTLNIFPKEDIENVKLRDGDLYIQTLEGQMKADIGDYIIRGVKGEYYPCKPDVFEMTYEPVNK